MFTALVIAGIVFIVGGAVVAERFMRTARAPEPVPEVPTVAIAAAGEGVVQIAGTVELLGKEWDSPVSKTPCVYYEHVVERERERSVVVGTVTEREVIHHARSGVPFLLRDASGHAVIEPDGASSQLPVHHQKAEGGRPKGLSALDPTAETRPLLHHTEYVVRPGDQLIVAGTAVREPDPDAPADPRRTRMRLRHTDESPLELIHREQPA